MVWKMRYLTFTFKSYYPSGGIEDLDCRTADIPVIIRCDEYLIPQPLIESGKVEYREGVHHWKDLPPDYPPFVYAGFFYNVDEKDLGPNSDPSNPQNWPKCDGEYVQVYDLDTNTKVEPQYISFEEWKSL